MSDATNEIRAYLVLLGRKGGKARLTKMTPEQRQAIARTAAQARWSKQKGAEERKNRKE